MNKRKFITLRSVKSNEETVLEVSSSRPVSEILPDIIKILNWPILDENGDPLFYMLTDESGSAISQNCSLSETGIDNFAIVYIKLDDTQQKRILQERGSGPAERIPGRKTAQDKDKLLPQPVPFMIPVEGPCLISDNGIIFMIGDTPTVIGRKGKTSIPQIDLSDLDHEQIVSHSHAAIEVENEQYVLHTLHPRNGMFLNGAQMAPESIFPLNDGDQLRFGFSGSHLIWRNVQK